MVRSQAQGWTKARKETGDYAGVEVTAQFESGMARRENMNKNWKAIVAIVALNLLAITVQAQDRMTIQANVMGTGTQLGRLFDVHIYIEQLSPPDDRQALVEAFARSGQSGVRDVLEHMKSKGRVRFSSGGVGNDVKYIIELPSDKGRRFRLVTDRNIAFGELYHSTRSSEYDIGAMELTVMPDGKGSGKVLPACKLKLNKQKQIEIETYQNPWNLNIYKVTKN
jgi:hypothetical protein